MIEYRLSILAVISIPLLFLLMIPPLLANATSQHTIRTPEKLPPVTVIKGKKSLRSLALPPQIPSLQPGNPTINPISNSHTVPVTSSVSITYDEAISSATVSTRTFAVHAIQTGLLTKTYSVSGGMISLTPPQPFKPGELVQVSATTGTLNLSGQGPISPTIWQFRAAPAGGYGHFAVSTQTFPISDTSAVALGDVNGDGAVDALVINLFEANEIWLNDGTGQFSLQPETLGNTAGLSTVLGDLDGDGDLDAVISDLFLSVNEIWLNNGKGVFTQSSQIYNTFETTLSLALGDVDGDGDLDLFIGRAPAVGDGSNQVWLNDGTGVFTDSKQSLGNSHTYGVALGDLDGDGDLDAFAANGGPFEGNHPNHIWLNDGTGVFTNPNSGLGNASSMGVALGDLNDDGHLDAFVINSGTQPNEVWFNNGNGTFTNSGQQLGNSNSWAIDLGDLDGDDDLDAFVGNTDLALTGAVAANTIWLNDGQGNFFRTLQQLGQATSSAVALSDLNGDGDLDAFVGNADPNVISYTGQGEANKVWFNVLPNYYLPLITKNSSS